jgi:hypothetical protein
MNIHRLHKHVDAYGYGCEVTDIHGYPDISVFHILFFLALYSTQVTVTLALQVGKTMGHPLLKEKQPDGSSSTLHMPHTPSPQLRLY